MAEAAESTTKKPVCLIVLGMAGAGKTSLVQKLSLAEKTPYVINLDPAVLHAPYTTNIDIRDTVNYKEVMKQFNLGPNGAIVTALNLFSTKFTDVLKYIETCNKEICILDTPGQIEVFTWSVSGTLITEGLGSSFPTVILYVMDTVRSTNPVTFMSNMLYACSILYKTRLPFIIVMNKTDVVDNGFAIEWINNFQTFFEALENSEQGYINNLTRSMVFTLDKFYENMKVCGVSAATGDGIDQLYTLIEEARIEYEADYRVEWEKNRAERAQRLDEQASTSESDDIHLNREVFLRQPGDVSSSDSEGEEMSAREADEQADTFKKVVEQQRNMQIKRAKEAEAKKNIASSN